MQKKDQMIKSCYKVKSLSCITTHTETSVDMKVNKNPLLLVFTHKILTMSPLLNRMPRAYHLVELMLGPMCS